MSEIDEAIYDDLKRDYDTLAARLAEAERLLRDVERASNDELRAEEISELYEEISVFLRAANAA